MPGASSFFAIRDPFIDDAVRMNLRESPEVDELVSLMRSEEPARPIEVIKEGGEQLYDVVWTGYAFFFLVAGRVVETLEASKLTGWNAHPVISSNFGSSAYWWLSVSGRCGPATFGAGIRRFPTGAARVSQGLSFDLRSWDGSDVFMPSDRSAWVLISVPAAEALQRLPLTNADLVPLHEISF